MEGEDTTMKHEMEYKCTEQNNCGGTCYGCTLGSCKNCGQSEGNLATECPMKKISSKVADAIYAGEVDFIGGFWVKGKNYGSARKAGQS